MYDHSGVSGALGEVRAEQVLAEKGFSILARNYRIPGAEIDRVNILQATKNAMALAAKDAPCDLFLVDAISKLDVPGEVRGIIHGDAVCYSVAAASILAKVTRDRIMREYDEMYPEFGFGKNKGYGTAQHIEALKKYGPTPIHRRSFIGKFI